MSEPFINEIRMVAFNFPPRGWAFCNGQLLPINQNQALFSLLGTTYGGNGTTTFALPNLQGRVPLHFGTGPGGNYDLGQAGGTEAHTLTVNETPAHSHTMSAVATPAAGQRSLSGNMPGTPSFNLYAATPSTTMATQSMTNTGGNQPHANLQPYTVISFCIALQGIFPSRN